MFIIIIHCTSSLTIFGFGHAIPVTHIPDIIYQILMRRAVLTSTCTCICICINKVLSVLHLL